MIRHANQYIEVTWIYAGDIKTAWIHDSLLTSAEKRDE
jgi:hypothetical protein